MKSTASRVSLLVGCVVIGAGGVAAYANSPTGNGLPLEANVQRAPEWMIPGPDGKIDRSDAPSRIAVGDIDGTALLDEKGQPITVPNPELTDITPAAVGSPELKAALARQQKLVELGLVTERLEDGALVVEFHPERLSKAQRALMAQGKLDQVIAELDAQRLREANGA